ncbi:LLM class flavin-dependent oxidoreductase [Longispora urticae]
MRVHGPALRLGLHSGQQYRDFDEPLLLWRRAEELGYDWISLFDHYRPPIDGPGGPCLDGPSLLAALAARTGRIRCAMLVSAVTWRPPAIAAAIAATLDHVSGGRLEFGLGAGSADHGYAQYGIPFPDVATRLGMLDEACRIVRRLWTEPVTTFDGAHFQLRDAYLEPKPVQARVPLVIGGSGRRLLGIAAEHADIWNTLAGDLTRYRARVAVLERHCRELGRPAADIRRSVTFRVVLGADEATARARMAERVALLPADSPDLAEYLMCGTPRQCVEALAPFVRDGVGDLILAVRPPLDWATIELFAREVSPALRALASRGAA